VLTIEPDERIVYRQKWLYLSAILHNLRVRINSNAKLFLAS